jgi:hypothetical protein
MVLERIYQAVFSEATEPGRGFPVRKIRPTKRFETHIGD